MVVRCGVGALPVPDQAFQAGELQLVAGAEGKCLVLVEGRVLALEGGRCRCGRWKVPPSRNLALCAKLVGENRASPWNCSIGRAIRYLVLGSWAGRLFHLGHAMICVTDLCSSFMPLAGCAVRSFF